MHERRVTSV